jgi:primosomal protein N' (replication factor Y)
MVRLIMDLPSLLQREQTFARAKQQRVVYDLLEAQGGAAPLDALRIQANCSAGVFTAMAKRGLVEIRDDVQQRDPFADRVGTLPPPNPSAAQQEAVRAILAGDPGQVFLLHGVTGSGKTLVYIEVLRAMLQQRDKTAIVLVPEIALTSQTVDRFRGAFGDDVAVLHSGLSDGERLDAWQSLRRGERRIAVGARSALFAPLERVGVVIVDEEHESSYKQSETPRYHAREAAIVRARIEGAVVVLGSATPSLETWERADRGQAIRLTLPDRAAGAQLPPVSVVDMRVELKQAVQARNPNAPFDETLGVFSTSLNTSAANVAPGSFPTLGPCHWISTATALIGSSLMCALLPSSAGMGGIGSALNGSSPRGQAPNTCSASTNTCSGSTSPVTIKALLFGT